MANQARIPLPIDRIAEFSRRWRIVEFSLFGSVLRDDFSSESDVDVLVTFAEDTQVSLWDWGPVLEKLGALFGRKVDLVEKSAIKNPFRRKSILGGYEVIYADRGTRRQAVW